MLKTHILTQKLIINHLINKGEITWKIQTKSQPELYQEQSF